MDSTKQLVLKQRISTALLEASGRRVHRDADGDWPTPVGTTHVYVRMEMTPSAHAVVFTEAATGTTEDCLRELNELNGTAAWCKLLRSSAGDIFVTQRVRLRNISATSMRSAIQGVAECAETCGPMLQAVYSSGSDQ
jgi:hypothetical protein